MKKTARPLTKRTREDVIYTRPLSVESQIKYVLTLNLPSLKKKLEIGNPKQTNYLLSETLVYLVRDSI